MPSPNYAARDYATIVRDSVERIPALTDEWTDLGPNDPGMVLVHLMAGIADTLHYYLDATARELSVETVQGRRSMVSLAALVGARLLGKSPSTVRVDFKLSTSLGATYTVPVGSRLLSTGGVYFETLEAAVFQAGQTSVQNIRAIAGRTYTSSPAITATGGAFQEYLVKDSAEILDTGMVVSVAGTPWAFTETLSTALPGSTVWTYRRTAEDRVYIQFGNGDGETGFGLAPANGQQIVVTWREGGGASSNVPPRTVTQLSGVTPPVGATLSVVNPSASRGGSDAETIEHARKRIPALYRSQGRCVTAEDYEAHALSAPGVVLAHAHVVSPTSWEVVIVADSLVGIGSGTDPFGYQVLTSKAASEAALAQTVALALADKKSATDHVTVRLAQQRYIDIEATVKALKGASIPGIHRAIGARAQALFAPASIGFGRSDRESGTVAESDLVGAIEQVSGVDSVEITKFHARPQIEIVRAVGAAGVTSVFLTERSRDAIWTVVMLSATSYAVYRQEFPTPANPSPPRWRQRKTGVVNVPYTDDNAEINLHVTLDPDGTRPLHGDTYKVRSSRLRGSVRIPVGEIAALGRFNLSVI